MRPVRAVADPRPVQLPLAGGREGATVRLHPLRSGELRTPPEYLDRRPGPLGGVRGYASLLGPRKGWIALPVPAFLVEHPTAGPLLVDTGLHPSVADDPRGELGRYIDARMDPEEAIRTQVLERGVDPKDIAVVVMTHLHVDHASGVREFPDASFLVTRAEMEAARRGGPRQGYRREHFEHDFDWRTIEFGDGVASYATFGRALDLFGDGSVRLVATPGHTPGHQSVLLRLGDREALLAGDAIYLRRQLDRDGPRPLIVSDAHLYRRSIQEIRLFGRQSPGALLVPGHDPEVWADLAEVYK